MPTRTPPGPYAAVLVVDDDPHVREMLVRELRPVVNGDIVEAGSGAEALAHLADGPAALVVLDLGLPGGLDGFGVLEWMRGRQECRRTPVIVVTIREEGAALVRALHGGADDYFWKSNDWDLFRARAERLLDRSGDHERDRTKLRDELTQTQLMAAGLGHDLTNHLLALENLIGRLPAGAARDQALAGVAGMREYVAELRWLGPALAEPTAEPADLGAIAARVLDGFVGWACPSASSRRWGARSRGQCRRPGSDGSSTTSSATQSKLCAGPAGPARSRSGC